jgi:hypothetical protein
MTATSLGVAALKGASVGLMTSARWLRSQARAPHAHLEFRLQEPFGDVAVIVVLDFTPVRQGRFINVEYRREFGDNVARWRSTAQLVSAFSPSSEALFGGVTQSAGHFRMWPPCKDRSALCPHNFEGAVRWRVPRLDDVAYFKALLTRRRLPTVPVLARTPSRKTLSYSP